MDKTFEFKSSRTCFKTRFRSQILLKRMKFAEIKMSVFAQNFTRLLEDKINIFDTLKRERTSYQIERTFGKIPNFANIQLAKFDIFSRNFCFCTLRHFRRKICANEFFGFRLQKIRYSFPFRNLFPKSLNFCLKRFRAKTSLQSRVFYFDRIISFRPRIAGFPIIHNVQFLSKKIIR